MERAAELAQRAAQAAWGPGLLILLLGAGAYFTLGSGLFPLRRAGYVWRATLGGLFAGKGEKGAVSPFAAMSTALGATVGTGNVVGVAAAISAGGAGAVFWMWIGAALGMMTKFAEAVLALRYRVPCEHGWRGGPMYYIERGLGLKPLAVLYALLCALSSFGMGNMVQANSAAAAAKEAFGAPEWATGLLMAGLTAAVLFAGANSVAKAASALVPLMALGYTVGCVWVLVGCGEKVPQAFALIFEEAFSARAAAGGLFGTALREGISKGVFSNEAGMGSAAIAHAASSERDPAKQGCWGILEVFIDTMVICTLTAVTLLVTGADCAGENGAALAARTFSQSFGRGGGWFMAAALFLFALAAVLGWAYYGEQALGYLTGGRESVLTAYRILFAAAAALGAGARIGLVWSVSDVMNAALVLPNLAALIFLSPEVFQAIKSAGQKPGAG